jgi:hypothetical protein
MSTEVFVAAVVVAVVVWQSGVDVNRGIRSGGGGGGCDTPLDRSVLVRC